MRFNTHPKSLACVIAFLLVILLNLSSQTVGASETEKTEYSVQAFAPRDENGGVADFMITFSKSLIDNSQIYTELPSRAIQITPAVQGKARWMAADKIGFFLENSLAPSINYTIEVSTQLNPSEDFVLTGQRKFTYLTRPFQVERAEIGFQYDEKQKKAKAVGTIAFNYAVNITSLREFLSILTERGTEIPYTFQTQSAITKTAIIEIADITRLLEVQSIQVQIKKGFKCTGTEIGLKEPSVAPIVLSTLKTLQVDRVDVLQREGTLAIRLTFTSPVVLETLREHVSIDPSLPHQLTSHNHELEIRGDFKCRTDYTVRIKRGVTAADGSILKDTYQKRLTMPDLRPRVRFADNNIFLPRKGSLNLNLATTNVKHLTFGIAKVSLSSLPILVHNGELDIASRLNAEVITPFPLRDYLTDAHAGIFKILVDSDRHVGLEHLIIVTDLGIVTKKTNDALWVWIHSLDSLVPIPQAAVQLIDNFNNETLLTGKTDAAGFVKLSLPPDVSEEDTQLLLTVAKENDFSFLELHQSQISTQGFNVGGAPYLVKGHEGFLYTDRGVYRPGETVNLVGIVRGKNLKIPASLPIRIDILRPYGSGHQEFRKQTNKDGAYELQVPIPANALTGVYTARMWVAEKEVCHVSFQVEEFVPNRMKVSVETDRATYMLGDEVNIEVEAVNLFGALAAGRAVTASYSLKASPYVPPDKWRSFNFSDPTRTFNEKWVELGETRTNIDGKATYQFTLPDDVKPPALLNSVIQTTVQELGGRAVTASQQISIHPYSHYVGIKRPQLATVKRDEKVIFNYIVIDTLGNAAAGRTLKISVSTISGSQVTELESHTLTSVEEMAKFSYTPSGYGAHRVEIEDIAGGAKASTQFYVSEWGGVPWSMENPDRLEMTLDKSTYHPGETAALHINAPFPGKLLLTIEQDKVLGYQTFMLQEQTTTLPIPVMNAYAPNVYLSAVLIRSTKSLEKHMPARVFGIVPLKLDAEPHRLRIEIDAPEQIRSNREIDITFRVHGEHPGKPYQVSIAAVDEGILKLTDFQTPTPHDHFHQQRALETRIYELYTAITRGNYFYFSIMPIESLADLVNYVKLGKTVKYLRLGAARDSAGRFGYINANSVVRVTPVSFWSGLMTTDANGQGNVSFKVPQFNGTLRVMAVAFSGADYGSATGQIKVREPLVLTPTFPRFLSGGDRIRVPVTLFNGTGTTGDFTVELQAAGPVKLLVEDGLGKHPILAPTKSLQKQLKIAVDEEGHTFFDVSAHDTIGVAAFNLYASGNGETTKFIVRLPLRSAAPPVTKTGSGIVREGEAADFIFPANLRAETSEFALTISPLPAVKFAGGLHYLIQYPHGCLEQTTSRVFPLLYLSDLARIVEPTLAKDGKVDEYIEAGITKLENMLTWKHHFSYWPGGSFINNWSSIYASHFLVEARKAGYKVSDLVYNKMLEGLRHQAKQGGSINTPDEETDRYRLAQAAYACYVLAASGQPEKAVMHYLKNNRLNALTDYSQFQLAGAFALSGDLDTGLSMLPVSIDFEKTMQRETGQNFDSPIRAQAIILDVLAEVTENHPVIPKLVESLIEAASGRNRWVTTQENAFAFLALGKILKKQSHQEYTGIITCDGRHLADFDSTGIQYTSTDWDGARIKLTVKGKGTCYYYWTAFGVGRDSYIEEYGRELQVNRRYFNADGTKVNTVFKQGELVVAEITVKALTSDLANVAVVDMLPAGFEIENSRLASRASLPWLEQQAFNPDYIDIRDDRLIFFGAFPHQQERKFYYAIRAVTQGIFTVSPVSAEAMYDPTKAAVASSGTIQVVE